MMSFVLGAFGLGLVLIFIDLNVLFFEKEITKEMRRKVLVALGVHVVLTLAAWLLMQLFNSGLAFRLL